MVYFNKDFILFLKELALNNNTGWFSENKKRFEQEVKRPFEYFVNDLIKELNKVDNLHSISSKECIFRMNRDVRFSKDKSPYKTFVSALISPYGKKNKTYPGLYIQISAEEIRLYSGSHDLNTAQLQLIRQKIYKERKRFVKIISDKKFKNVFGEIKGERNSKVPYPFSGLTTEMPYITNKEFYYFSPISIETMFRPDFLNSVLEKYEICQEINQFLKEGLGE